MNFIVFLSKHHGSISKNETKKVILAFSLFFYSPWKGPTSKRTQRPSADKVQGKHPPKNILAT